MNEEKLQSDIAAKFSQQYPNKRGQLFHIANERNNKVQVYKALSIGIVPGVADFLFFSKDFNVATELKVKGSRHKVEHLKKQLEWGKVWEREGNVWRLCTTTEQAISCYNGNFKGITIEELENTLKSVKTKTIKIN